MSEVKNNPARSRFEVTLGDAMAACRSRRASGRIVLLHTEVPGALSGKCVASKLVRGTLDAAQAEGLKVVLRCGAASIRARTPGSACSTATAANPCPTT